MNTGIANIFIAWRKGQGSRRIIVGVIKRNSTRGERFLYIKEGVEEAQKDGFVPYPDFPDITKVYENNVIEIFAKRLNKPDREDIDKYYSYWEIAPAMKDDKYYLLAHTQGLLPTDNFEFLAEYNPVAGLSFMSEISSLSRMKLSTESLSEGDILRWEKDVHNKHDEKAVKLYKNDTYVGYVKRIHSRVFYKRNAEKLKVYIKSINKNGHINRVFIKVTF